MKVTLKIWRQKDARAPGHFETHEAADVIPEMSFLEMLDGVNEGLMHDSSIHCDELVSLPKSMLTRYVGTLPKAKSEELDRAIGIALELPVV